MAFPPISHMPFLSFTSSHLSKSSVLRSPLDIPAKTGRPSTLQRRPLYIRYLHLLPASQITQRMPDPCFQYTSTRRRTQSPLRTVVMQDRAEKVQPYVRTRRRLQGPNQSFARDALSDATSSHARILLFPSRRRRMAGSQFDDAPKSPALSPQVCHVRVAGSTRTACESTGLPP